MWGTAAYNLQFEPGVHTLAYEFPSLPLRPGPYNWLVSLFDDNKELDMWEAVPQLLVATDNQQHPRDEWTGLLNTPSKLSVFRERRDHE